MSDYDLCVIGGGPSGYAAAMRAWDFGKRVAIVEAGELGGAGVHRGALSSKTLWELSRDYRRACLRDRGYTSECVVLRYEDIVECVRRAGVEKVRQLREQLEALAKPGPHGPGSIELVQGRASFTSPHAVRVVDAQGELRREIRAEHFVIATGSRPRTVPEIPVDGERILTSDQILELREFPESLVVVGAGVVGCEFATVFANFGRTEVHLIDRADRILPFEDEDIARVCSRNLESRGAKIHQRAQLRDIRALDDGVEYTIEHPTGERETFRVERALVSIGRVPNTDGMGLEAIGVERTPRGHIANDDAQTTVPSIYAAGDVTDDVALVNVAELEGRHAVERLWGTYQGPLSRDHLSTILFLDPEVAAIGLNEQEAEKRRTDYRVAVYGYRLVNRAVAMRATDGFVKLLVGADEDMQILGMRALGVHASTMLESVSLMMQLGRSVREIAELIHPHPAITEGLQDCVRMLTGTSIYKPHVFSQDLRLAEVRFEPQHFEPQHFEPQHFEPQHFEPQHFEPQ